MPTSQGSTRRVEAFLLPDGTEIWLLGRRLFHRHDGPAVIHPDGRVEWWFLGEWQDDGEPGRLAGDEYVPVSPVAIPPATLDSWMAAPARPGG